MSEQKPSVAERAAQEQVQEADSRVDAVAAVCLILLAVVAAVFWVSNQ